MQRQLCEFLDNVDTVPLAMLVATSGLLTNKKQIQSFLTKTQDKLPAGCPVIGCVACGIIGETSDGSPEELEDHGRGVSALVIPKIKGVNAHMFSFSKNEISKNRRNKQSWRNSFRNILEEDIKFVFLIGHTEMHQSIGKVAMEMKKVQCWHFFSKTNCDRCIPAYNCDSCMASYNCDSCIPAYF